MKRTLTLCIIGIMAAACSTTKSNHATPKYFDQNNLEIDKKKYKRLKSTRKFIGIIEDSDNSIKLVIREKHGTINSITTFRSLLEKTTNQELDPNKPIVIIYYTGKDFKNRTSKEKMEEWYAQLNFGLWQISGTTPIYIYKYGGDLSRNNEGTQWYKDPQGTIEKLFFKYPYPFQSFVVISKTGEFISYYGEFPKEYVWKTVQLMSE